ncbi:hypothetical protein MM236_02240 [Belliella sp. DSM 107340]|uniref:Uncharacterized protein n=1 Tax=Belliella calami TaxID=2923436 RepID=A0ABS9UJI9_9BACT|nr:hypothetical protein [Belliella calami]MCH7396784.1 hypothetical protein [Belliella calami]
MKNTLSIFSFCPSDKYPSYLEQLEYILFTPSSNDWFEKKFWALEEKL